MSLGFIQVSKGATASSCCRKFSISLLSENLWFLYSLKTKSLYVCEVRRHSAAYRSICSKMISLSDLHPHSCASKYPSCLQFSTFYFSFLHICLLPIIDMSIILQPRFIYLQHQMYVLQALYLVV